LAPRLAETRDTHLVLVDQVNPSKSDEALKALVARPNVTFMRLDLTSPGCMDRIPSDVEIVFHGAAVLGVEQVLKSPDRVLQINALSTLNVFNFAKQLQSVRRVVFASTSEVYAGTLRHFGIPLPTPEHVPICIDDVTLPRTSYALSKIYGEAIAFAWRSSDHLPVTVVRYHNVYGPRMGFRHVIPQTFVKIANSTGKIEVPSAGHTRAFCYIEDAVEATIRCWEAGGAEGKIINIGHSTEEISIFGLVQKIARVMGRNIFIEQTTDTPGSPARRCPDTSKLKLLTGYVSRVSLDDGLAKTYSWYKERLQ
jgi:UDP-glucose 4-epimerase